MSRFLFVLTCVLFSCTLNAQNAPCSNGGFESSTVGSYTAANAISGWTVSSQTRTNCTNSNTWTPGSPEFSVLSLPHTDPVIGTLSSSPFGLFSTGSKIVRLNNTTANSSVTKLSQTFSVSSFCSYFRFSYAGIWQNGSHSCCDEAGFKVLIKDCNGNVLSNPSFSLAGSGCPYVPTYSTQSGNAYTNWSMYGIDLNPYQNTCVTIEFIVNDCTQGDHYGTVYLDTDCGVCNWLDCCMGFVGPLTPIQSVFCPGTTTANISTFPGYSAYSWSAPAGYPLPLAQVGLSSITVTNAVVGNVYTVSIVNAPTGILTYTYALANTSVSIGGIGSLPSCPGGASGSATVVPNGSMSGYVYNWYNSTNSLVSTSSVAANLAPGIYSVNLQSGLSNCGLAAATVTVGAVTPTVINMLKPYCSNQSATLDPGGGTNFKWYSGSSLISGSQGGTVQAYVVSTPTNLSVYHLSYLSPQGCQDSIKYTLVAVAPGSLSIPYNKLSCPGSSNGVAIISMTPSSGSPPGFNSFQVTSTGTTGAYSASLNPTSFNSFTATQLSAGGVYSVSAFDGNCKYNTTFTASVLPPFNYTLIPGNSPTVCAGNSIVGAITFTANPSLSQYSYNWSPTTWLVGGNGSYQNTIITPVVSTGTSATLIYTVVVTPSVANCPVTKTISVTAYNLAAPVITSVQAMCSNAAVISIPVSPAGGLFSSSAPGAVNPSTGLITPSLSSIGINSFTYSVYASTCVASASGTYLVNQAPLLNISGDNQLCSGESTILNAQGATSYNWNNGMTTASISLSPLSNTTIIVTGVNANGCTATKSLSIIVSPVPTLNIVSSGTICSGKIATITASGASTYSWSNNVTSGVNMVSPATSTTYTVYGFNTPECSDTAVVNINVSPTPTLNVTGDVSICAGESTLLTATGATNYLWNNNAVSAIIGVTPANTTTYMVTGTTGACSGTQTVAVLVQPCTNLKGENIHGLKIYPNPVFDKLVVENEFAQSCEIVNEKGITVLVTEMIQGKNVLDLGKLNPGIYFAKFRGNDQSSVFKIVKAAN